jgi:hypothetical protein
MVLYYMNWLLVYMFKTLVRPKQEGQQQLFLMHLFTTTHTDSKDTVA